MPEVEYISIREKCHMNGFLVKLTFHWKDFYAMCDEIIKLMPLDYMEKAVLVNNWDAKHELAIAKSCPFKYSNLIPLAGMILTTCRKANPITELEEFIAQRPWEHPLPEADEAGADECATDGSLESPDSMVIETPYLGTSRCSVC